MENYSSNLELAQEISARIGTEPIPFESVSGLCYQIYEELGGTRENYNDVYSILLDILPLTNLIDDSSVYTNKTWSSDKINTELSNKQDTLIEGSGITIVNNVISATGGSTVGYTYDSSNNSIAIGYKTTASGVDSYAEGQYSQAKSYATHAEGRGTEAIGQYAHAEGFSTHAEGYVSHAEGRNTTAGYISHAEGYQTSATGEYAHAEGYQTSATTVEQYYQTATSHAEGYRTLASGLHAHAEGGNSIASGNYTHAEGANTTASGSSSHAEGYVTKTLNQAEHAQGMYNNSHKLNTTFGSSGNTLHSIGIGTDENTQSNAVEVMQNADVYIKGVGGYDGVHIKSEAGYETVKTLQQVINGKQDTLTAGENIDITNDTISAKGYKFNGDTNGGFAEKYKQDATDGGQVVENTATGLGSHAEGYGTSASGDYGCHAEGNLTQATGYVTHAEGNLTKASETASHAEGGETEAKANYAHAEGYQTKAIGRQSHAEGGYTKAKGLRAHAEGEGSSADNICAVGDDSHTEGLFTQAQNYAEHAQGAANVSHKTASNAATEWQGDGNHTLHSIGNGRYVNTQSNAVEVMQNADVYIKGVGGYDGVHIKSEAGYETVKTLQQVISGKQDTLTAGENIYIANNTIYALGYLYDESHNSITNGDGCATEGEYSHAEGYATITHNYAQYSHAEGVETETNNIGEHAQGRYNVSHSVDVGETKHEGNTIVSVGIGEDGGNRKNAFEIMQNGDIYVYGLGNYDGTATKVDNPSVMTLQDILKTIADATGVYIGVLF